MIKDCFTDETKIFNIKSKGLLEYNEKYDEEYKLIAKKISEETGVNPEFIYYGETGFRVYNWHKVDDEWYYYKNPHEDAFYKELLGEVISEYFDLDTVHYKIAKLIVEGKDDSYGIASKNFYDRNMEYTHLNMPKCGLDYFNKSFEVLDKIRVLCNSDKEFMLLQNDFKKMIIRDFYSFERDRRIANFLFCETPNGLRLAPLYDYGWSYIDSNDFRTLQDYLDFDLNSSEIRDGLRNDAKFQELLNTLMDADISSFIEKVEQNHKIVFPESQIEHYKKYEKSVKNKVVEAKLIV